MVADRLATCLGVSDVSGGGVLHCVLLVPIHSGVEARNCRNLPEMLVTMRVKVLKVDTWFSTVSCSTFQPAMARPCPPSQALKQRKFPLLQRSEKYQPEGGHQSRHLLHVPAHPGLTISIIIIPSISIVFLT